MSSIFVNKQEFTNYIGCSYKTGRAKYDIYLELAHKDTSQDLTIYDLSKIDDVDLEVVKERCGKC